MTGAAGGLAGGLWAAFGARLVPGATYVLGVLRFDGRLEDASAVITGEGSLDAQSTEGKLVGEIAKRCAESGVPLHVVAGAVDPVSEARLGVASVTETPTLAEIERAASDIAGG